VRKRHRSRRTFDTYKVELSSADGGTDKQTLWIAKDSRKPVKMTANVAEMGGATITQEMVPKSNQQSANNGCREAGLFCLSKLHS